MTMGSTKVSWNCKKKVTISNSSVEVEYILAWEETFEIVWIQSILKYLGVVQKSSTPLLIDS